MTDVQAPLATGRPGATPSMTPSPRADRSSSLAEFSERAKADAAASDPTIAASGAGTHSEASMLTTMPPPLKPPVTGATRRTLITIAIIASLIAVAAGVVAWQMRSARDAATTERDAAQAAASLERERASTADDAFNEAAAELDAARADNDALTEQLATLDEAQAAVAAAEADNAELVAQNEELSASVKELSAQLEVASAGVPASADIDDMPDLARYIGESLSSRSGTSRLSQSQSTCFGTAIVSDIGLDALGRGLSLGATTDDNNLVVGAMQSAASACNIDQALIF